MKISDGNADEITSANTVRKPTMISSIYREYLLLRAGNGEAIVASPRFIVAFVLLGSLTAWQLLRRKTQLNTTNDNPQLSHSRLCCAINMKCHRYSRAATILFLKSDRDLCIPSTGKCILSKHFFINFNLTSWRDFRRMPDAICTYSKR